LIVGAGWLIDGALKLARRFGASDLAVGLTVVSIGTSVPELVVNVAASLRGSPDLAIGNILGSNIANVLLILGAAGAFRALPIRDRTILSEIPICLAATLLVGFLANAHLFTTVQILTLSRLDGLILLGFFALFLGYVYRTAQDGLTPGSFAPDERSAYSGAGTALRILGGVLALAVGGEWVVRGALGIVENAGVSESLVGLTVLALGTSAPELVATASAIYRGKTDVAVGNIIGSNIFNLLWVLGVSSVIRPLPFDLLSNNDLVMVVVSNALLLLAMAVGRPNTVDRWEGWGFLAVYGAYFAFLVDRG
ncbi:MAG: calcium/sodium antiporter, partial [Deltaproteobacteria bacterium]|nr:calcium/sodium antiporter [Deltaproteobacteria bacterium]